jgi:hypothetical protein
VCGALLATCYNSDTQVGVRCSGLAPSQGHGVSTADAELQHRHIIRATLAACTCMQRRPQTALRTDCREARCC